MPLPPRNVVVVTDWDEHAASETIVVNIKWKKPLDDVGFPISKYHVEATGMGKDNWQKCRKSNARLKLTVIGDCHATVAEVPIQEEYQFRVIAINKRGRGRASDPTTESLKTDSSHPPNIHLTSPTTENLQTQFSKLIIN